jgi:hypothetical protein
MQLYLPLKLMDVKMEEVAAGAISFYSQGDLKARGPRAVRLRRGQCLHPFNGAYWESCWRCLVIIKHFYTKKIFHPEKKIWNFFWRTPVWLGDRGTKFREYGIAWTFFNGVEGNLFGCFEGLLNTFTLKKRICYHEVKISSWSMFYTRNAHLISH